MQRRDFLKLAATTAATMAAQGNLPLLAAGMKRGTQRGGPRNIFTEPCAIEPVTGYLGQFSPPTTGGMAAPFKAHYALIHWNRAGTKSGNSKRGDLNIGWDGSTLSTSEIRKNRPSNIVKTSIQCTGKHHTAASWRLVSSFDGKGGNRLIETGAWDGKTMTVKATSWTQSTATSHPLIARWALLPLLSSGALKGRPLTFDMLDDSTLRPDQTIRYQGEIAVPVKSGSATLSSYLQTGYGIVPTHYLVDKHGRVQLITMAMVNWALGEVKG